ncbi:unnamed protein product [Trichogramma brassicae]|uniref:Major facilitator superfamily (MFS) profile domain-containing protein n=1 Tax=Trichogramma brassicae TaxID=86971 RepID=A0A6H5J6X9_9HYME|nr:unnamed protein product [Trichogramma brassicae]
MHTQAYVEMIVPPDGGWGWVIVAASFMCNLVVDGIMFSYGVFFDHIKQHYNATSAQVSLAGSLQTGFYLMAGPFVSALANRYGFRMVSILGAFIACNAFLLSYFANSIELLYVFYGILGGIGAGLIYVPAVITTGFYFEKWRALATGISVCGSGIGTLVMAPISQALIAHMGWRGAIVVQAERAGKAGIDSNTATLLISVIGIGNTIGRIGLGYVSSLPGVDALTVNNIFITLSGFLTIASGLSMSQGYQFFYAAAFGLSVSVFASLRSIIVVDLMGLEKLTNAFGLLLLFQGVGAVVGSPIASAFVDGTGSHTLAFYFAGFDHHTLGCHLLPVAHRINEKEKRQQALREVPILLKT